MNVNINDILDFIKEKENELLFLAKEKYSESKSLSAHLRFSAQQMKYLHAKVIERFSSENVGNVLTSEIIKKRTNKNLRFKFGSLSSRAKIVIEENELLDCSKLILALSNDGELIKKISGCGRKTRNEISEWFISCSED